jgi:hypothetical protein
MITERGPPERCGNENRIHRVRIASTVFSEVAMSNKMSRRAFFGRSIKVAAGAAATRLLGGGQQAITQAVDWVAKYRAAVFGDEQWMIAHGMDVAKCYGYLDKFMEAIQKAGFTLGQFAQARGLTCLSMEYEMFIDDLLCHAEGYINTLPKILEEFLRMGGM